MSNFSSNRSVSHSIKFNSVIKVTNSYKHLLRESFTKKRIHPAEGRIRSRYPANDGRDTIELFPGMFMKIN